MPLHDISAVLVMPETIEFAFYEKTLDLVMARQAARSAMPIDPMPELKLYCRSNGGDSRSALAIVNLIKADGNVHGIMVGECASSAATIWAACQRRSVMPIARMGIHPVAWEDVEGIADQKRLMSIAEEFVWTDGQQCHIYADASDKPFQWWWERYNATSSLHWFTAEELVEMHMAVIWQGMPY